MAKKKERARKKAAGEEDSQEDEDDEDDDDGEESDGKEGPKLATIEEMMKGGDMIAGGKPKDDDSDGDPKKKKKKEEQSDSGEDSEDEEKASSKSSGTDTDPEAEIEEIIVDGMPKRKYKRIAKKIFLTHDSNDDGIIDMPQFKRFAVQIAKAAGVEDYKIEGNKATGRK